MNKNTASQSVTLLAINTSTGLPATGDAANQVYYVSKDDGAVTAISSNSGVPTEVDSTNAKGSYKIALAQAETNGDKLLFTGKSSTANVVIVPLVVTTAPPYFSATSINSSGQMALGSLLATALTETTAGNLAAAFKKFFDVSSPTGTLNSLPAAIPGANGGLPTGDASGHVTLAAVTHTGAIIPRVTLLDTLTTYTGNTPQSGDAFALIGTAGVGLTNLGDTRIAHLNADINSRQATITWPTGFLTTAFSTTVGTSTYSGGPVASVTAGVNLAANQHVIVDSGTVTYLTNAPTAGDFTPTMKTSLITAASAATPVASLAPGSIDTPTLSFGLRAGTLRARLTSTGVTSPASADFWAYAGMYSATAGINEPTYASQTTGLYAWYNGTDWILSTAVGTLGTAYFVGGTSVVGTYAGTGTATGTATIAAHGNAILSSFEPDVIIATPTNVAAAILSNTSYKLTTDSNGYVTTNNADPLAETVPGSYTSGQAGYAIAAALAAIVSTLASLTNSQSNVTVVADAGNSTTSVLVSGLSAAAAAGYDGMMLLFASTATNAKQRKQITAAVAVSTNVRLTLASPLGLTPTAGDLAEVV